MWVATTKGKIGMAEMSKNKNCKDRPMYEWKHFFDLRMQGTTGAPHPMIQDLSTMLYDKMLEVYHYAFYEN